MRIYSAYVVFAILAIAATQTALAQDRYMYWIGAVQPEETRGTTIFRYALDAGTLDTLVQARDLGPDEKRYFYGVAVDTLADQIYWTDSGGTLPDGTLYLGAIMRADAEGSNPEIVLGGIVCGTGSPADIEIDQSERMLYWSEGTDCPFVALNRTALERPRIFQSNLPIDRVYSASALELDAQQRMLYWTNTDFFRTSPHGIIRAPVDDTEADEYIVQGTICDIALAPALEKIYWIDCNRRMIRRANLDGTNPEDMVETRGDVGDAAFDNSLAIDHVAGKIYWSETSNGTIRRANLDGSEVEVVLSGLVVPSSLALGFGGYVGTHTTAEVEAPATLRVRDIYPNPAQHQTTITFDVAAPSHVTVSMYDVLGRRVETLVSRPFGTGTFRVEWESIGNPSGVYFVCLVSAQGQQTIPIVVRR